MGERKKKKLEVEIKTPKKSSKKAVNKATEKKKKATETIEEAWVRIDNMKNSAKDIERIEAVKKAMEEGKVGRLPEDASNRFSKAEVMRMYKRIEEEIKTEKFRKLLDSKPANYFLIRDEKQLDRVVSEVLRENEVAIDTETTGVDVYVDVMVGLSISMPSITVHPLSERGKHVYIPFDHEEKTKLNRELVLDKLSDFLYSKDIGKVLHNAVFDIAMFRRHGYDLLGVTWDTQIAMFMLNENEPSYRLKDLAPKYLGAESDTFDELFGKNARFDSIPLDIATVYAAKDTHLTWDLYQFQLKHMKKMPTVYQYYREVEVPLLYVIVDLEANGYVLDLEYAKRYGNELTERAAELRKVIIGELSKYHKGDGVINLNSPQQVLPALSEAIGVDLPNMDAKRTLKPLAGKHELVGHLLEYKKIVKLSGTYIDALPERQNRNTKRWHSRFNPMGTVTGRFSSGKGEEAPSDVFNVQNQPDEARPMFLAPEGKVLVGADFKAQEIRCTAYMSGEPALIQAFKEGKDPYASMASLYYGKPHDEVNKNPDGSDTEERSQMKVIWLATLYGMSDYSIAESLSIDVKAAREFKEQVFGTMPQLEKWLKENERFVIKNGFVWADGQKRKRRLPDARLRRKQIPYGKWNDPAYEDRRKHNASINRALRQATNARVQGSSSIQTKVTMLRAYEECKKREGWRIWATIHDEIIFEVPETITREEIEVIRDLMVNSYKWGDEVENGTDIEIMRRWGEGVTVDAWFND